MGRTRQSGLRVRNRVGRAMVVEMVLGNQERLSCERGSCRASVGESETVVK